MSTSLRMGIEPFFWLKRDWKSEETKVFACITRLRVNLKDIKQANIDSIKALGAVDVVVVGDNLQAIFGTQSDNIKTDMTTVLGSS
ncbi:hypothetical protein [Grimontia kaedaensis]|uniref:hypothetical protein n=1 Tax=Grimontia kaedaensis TaxID=2872157 RepID=UPI003EBBB047